MQENQDQTISQPTSDDSALSIASSFFGSDENQDQKIDNDGAEESVESSNLQGQEIAEEDQSLPSSSEEVAPEERLYTAKINGEEKQVKASELLEHYQKGQAAELRFQEAAKIRHEAEAERKTLTEAIAAYYDQLEAIKQATDQDWVALAKENPQAWAEQKALREQIEAKQREAAEQYNALYAQQQQAEQEKFQEYCRQEAQNLKKAIPEWSTADAYDKGLREVAGYLSKFGFGDQDIGSMNDHRIWVVARKAMLFDKAVAEAPKAIQKAKPTRVEKVSSPVGEENKTKSALGRYEKTRNPDDLDAAFAEYLLGN